MRLFPQFPFSLALVFCVIEGAAAEAAIYKYVDAEGNVTFTDKYRPGARRLTGTDDGPGTAVVLRRSSAKAAPVKATPPDFPRVDGATQRRRDDVRRSILVEERAAEQANLISLRASLAAATGDKGGEAQARLRERVRRHEKNIELLDKELARLK